MSLFDPNPSETVDWLEAGGNPVSGDPLPELSEEDRKSLESSLHCIGVRVARSPDHADGWEDAYNAFAEAFSKRGARLTERQIAFDVPNMLFNFALKNGWFPYLTILIKAADMPDLLDPRRVDSTRYGARTQRMGAAQVSKKESLEWFKTRIRPAVLDLQLRESTVPTAAVEGKIPVLPDTLITPIDAVKNWKKRHSLTWSQLAQQCGMAERTLRQRICDPKSHAPSKKETLEPLAKKIGCKWDDLNHPKKSQQILPLTQTS